MKSLVFIKPRERWHGFHHGFHAVFIRLSRFSYFRSRLVPKNEQTVLRVVAHLSARSLGGAGARHSTHSRFSLAFAFSLPLPFSFRSSSLSSPSPHLCASPLFLFCLLSSPPLLFLFFRILFSWVSHCLLPSSHLGAIPLTPSCEIICSVVSPTPEHII